jgi:hypothetical protein
VFHACIGATWLGSGAKTNSPVSARPGCGVVGVWIGPSPWGCTCTGRTWPWQNQATKQPHIYAILLTSSCILSTSLLERARCIACVMCVCARLCSLTRTHKAPEKVPSCSPLAPSAAGPGGSMLPFYYYLFIRARFLCTSHDARTAYFSVLTGALGRPSRASPAPPVTCCTSFSLRDRCCFA